MNPLDVGVGLGRHIFPGTLNGLRKTQLQEGQSVHPRQSGHLPGDYKAPLMGFADAGICR